MERWRQQARYLRRELYALYLACQDPRAPWYAKAVAFGLVAYAFSPIHTYWLERLEKGL
jgi:uncharacterized membrane protein YkvA (DUF1232 family)